jgi:threonine dehydrogenase-like Zn-dependent dehydrogenase
MTTKFTAFGKWIAVKTDIGSEKTTEQGVVYKDNTTKGHYVIAEVVSVGSEVTEDIRVGDTVYWELATNRGNHYEDLDLVHQDHVAAVVRNDA